MVKSVVNNLEDLLAFGADERQSRLADELAAEARFLHGELDVLHESMCVSSLSSG